MFRKTLAGIVLALPLWVNAAETTPSSWQFGGGLGLTMGGDEMGTVHIYRNGTRIQSENLRAGRLFHFDIGTRWRPASTPLMLQMTFGYHYNAANGKDLETGTEDVSAYFSRYPLEIIPALRLGRHSLGLGVRHDFNPMLAASGAGSLKFKDANGAVLEYGYSPIDNVTLGVRLVKIKYRPEIDEVSAKGDHVGINGRLWF